MRGETPPLVPRGHGSARLVEAHPIADGTYPNAAAVFAENGTVDPNGTTPTLDYQPAQPRDLDGRWTAGAGYASGGASQGCR